MTTPNPQYTAAGVAGGGHAPAAAIQPAGGLASGLAPTGAADSAAYAGPRAPLTLWGKASNDHAHYGKRAFVEAGQLRKVTLPHYARGGANRWVGHLGELAALLTGGRPGDGCAMFLTPGVHKDERVPIAPGGIARRASEFPWPEGPGFLILDIDRDHLPGGLVGQGWVNLAALVAGLRRLLSCLDVDLVAVPSAGSYLLSPGAAEPGTGLTGAHLWLQCSNGTLAARALWHLHRLACLAGLGHVAVTAAGGLVPRSLVDTAMATSNQPCYEWGANLLDGVVQDRTACGLAGLYLGGSKVLDCEALLNNEKAISEKYDAWLRAEKVQPEIVEQVQAKRDEWLERQLGGLEGEERVQRRATLLASMEARDRGERVTLELDFVLQPLDGQAVTVRQVLANPMDWQGRAVRFPFEEEYENGHATLRPLPRTGFEKVDKPCITGWPHGVNTIWALGPVEEEDGQTAEQAVDVNPLAGGVGFVTMMNGDLQVLHLQGPHKGMTRSFDAAGHFFANRTMLVAAGDGTKRVAAFPPLVKDPERVDVRGFTFRPDLPPKALTPDGEWNTWPGFATVPSLVGADESGLLPFWHEWRQWVSLLFSVSDGKGGRGHTPEAELHYKRVLQWAAHLLRFPWIRQNTSFNLIGGEGVGKGTFCEGLAHIIGVGSGRTAAARIVDAKMLETEWTAELEGALLVVINEPATKSKNTANRLKNWRTGHMVEINHKKGTNYYVPNGLHFLLTSNEDFTTYISDSARRDWVWRVDWDKDDPWQGPWGATWGEYCQWIARRMCGAGEEAGAWRAAVMWGLRHDVDLADYDPHAPAGRSGAKELAALASKSQQSIEDEGVVEYLLAYVEGSDAPGAFLKRSGSLEDHIRASGLRCSVKQFQRIGRMEALRRGWVTDSVSEREPGKGRGQAPVRFWYFGPVPWDALDEEKRAALLKEAWWATPF